jgi:hypothetical protein
MASEWKDFYSTAKRNVGPRYRKMRRWDADDWLATVGLERRNVAADLFGALGFIALGAGVGFAMGLVFAPKRGVELRRDVEARLRGTSTGRTGEVEGTIPPYVS